MKSPTLLLFDIDGTLILSGRAGLRGMNLAFAALYDQPAALEGVPIAGRTDRAIVSDALRGLGRDATDAAIATLREAYVRRLREEIVRPVPDRSCVLPGVTALLDTLDATPGAVSALLTGNFERGAEVKLGHFGLWERFAFGAFGDRHVNRNDLVPIALERARQSGHAFPAGDRVVVIGDTPLDIECAKVNGVRVLGVATGSYGREELEAAGADLTVDTLEDDRVVRWLVGD